MTDRKIDLKNPWLAGGLAFLVPGAGHLYQERYFKGVLYLVCILGTFLYGMHLGEWRAVYWTENPGQERFGLPAKKNLGFLAQLGFGTPSLIAYLQSRRYHTEGNRPVLQNIHQFRRYEQPEQNGQEQRPRIIHEPLTVPIDAEFTGVLVYNDDETPVKQVSGQLQLEPRNRTFQGTLKGTAVGEEGDEQSVTLDLGQALIVDSKVLGDPDRFVSVGVVDEQGNQIGELNGSIPRGFFNWFCAPMDEAVLHDLNRRLNKQFEMALVYTWIAGLLNILAIWDAVQGPAYGFGDEVLKKSESTDRAEKDKKPKPDENSPAEPSGTSGSKESPSPTLAEATTTDSAAENRGKDA